MKKKKKTTSVIDVKKLFDSVFDFTDKDLQKFTVEVDKLFDRIFTSFDNIRNSIINEFEDKYMNLTSNIIIKKQNGKITKVIIDGKEYVKKEK